MKRIGTNFFFKQELTDGFYCLVIVYIEKEIWEDLFAGYKIDLCEIVWNLYMRVNLIYK